MNQMSRYPLHIAIAPLFFILFIIHYVSCQLPSTQMTTMNTLHQLLEKTPNSKWNASQNLANPCSWPGVFCTSNNSAIVKLSLSSFSLSNSDDSWSSLVCGIETLQALDLSNNHMTSIPKSFLSSCGLKVLNFSRNRVSGPLPYFQGSLDALDLSFNLFDSVSVDSQFDDLNELKSLNISNNKFSGSVPTKLGKSMALEELQVSMNSFEGFIPDQITKYRNLSVLDLGHNRLIGTIPSRIDELSNLQILDLSYNNLTGDIPNSIFGITSLKQFAANYNNLTGSIPSRIGELINLEQLILSANHLTGEIPSSISLIATLKRFSANQNQFTGPIPEGITRYLNNLDLSYNLLNGSIPNELLSQPNLLTVDLSSNHLYGFIPSNVSVTLVRLRLGSNRLTGQIPSWSFGNNRPSLTYLELDHNDLSRKIPTELRLFKNLSLLDLSHNRLDGFVPPELGDLDKLQVLQLEHNDLSGEIPDRISGLRILVKLNMSWNSFKGSIPPSFSRLQNLTNLDLQVNDLSGEIPDSFVSMDSLLELQLGKNKLGGFINSLPTKLQIGLNLSHNNFQGPIPVSLSKLQELEVLDLSNNGFSGDIPTFLNQMQSLTQIILSNNLFTGSVPQFRPNVIVLTNGNEKLSYPTPSPFTRVESKKKPVSVAIVAASTSSVIVFMIVVMVAIMVSRSVESQPFRVQGVKSKLLTLNVIHRTNLDFSKAMEAVGYSSNIVLKTRFSTYYKAVMPSGTSYFVKKVNRSDKIFQLGTNNSFEDELEIFGGLRNSSVMIPLAYALTTDSAYLFYEFSEKGNLFDVLRGSGFDWTNRYSIALGVANGLAFLHGIESGPIILLDLSSKVVMLKSLNEPQIGDVEFSKVIDLSKSTGNLSAVVGSVGYVPPEYAYTMRVTMAGNVYSFGVILLELLTGKAAVSEGSELAKWVSSKSTQHDNIDQIFDSTVSRTSLAVRDQMLAVLKVALACVSDCPEARPKMKSVLRMLLNARN